MKGTRTVVNAAAGNNDIAEGGSGNEGREEVRGKHWGRAWKTDLERCFLALLE